MFTRNRVARCLRRYAVSRRWGWIRTTPVDRSSENAAVMRYPRPSRPVECAPESAAPPAPSRPPPATARRQCRAIDNRRACCNVEITAEVDSAPWVLCTPSACSPSYPPPVSGSYVGSPASLSPMNQAAAALTPASQIGLASRAAARAHRRVWTPRWAAGQRRPRVLGPAAAGVA
jgi:hypothetical protein